MKYGDDDDDDGDDDGDDDAGDADDDDDGDDGDDDGDDDDDDDGWREQELCSGAEAGGLWEREGPQGGTKVPVYPIYSHSLFLFSHFSL